MLVKLHANAATTPKMRAYLQASGRPAAELARARRRGQDVVIGQYLIDTNIRPILSARVVFRNARRTPPQSAGRI
jgi:hypothetical protein